MAIPYVSEKIAEFKLSREKARRKRMTVLILCGVGALLFFAGSVVAGVLLFKSSQERSERRTERRRAVRDRVREALDFDDDTPVAAYYDSEKKEFVKKEEKA